MVLNIAANARDAMPDGGHFTHSMGRNPEGIMVQTLADNGHGVDVHVQQQIFNPFFSTKSGAGGTGLGLTSIHDMVLNAGGDITVDSAPGQGTAFHVLLPPPQDAAA